MRIPVDKRVWPAAFVLMGLVILAAIFFRSLLWFFLVVLLAHLLFFREPQRTAPRGNISVSPADGRIAEISECEENRFLKRPAVKIGITLSVFVPHVNRAPIEGSVRYLDYQPGKFLNALSAKSVNNESNWIGIERDQRKALVRQMAGAVARKIYWDVRLNQSVDRGDKLGIICYGSRVECYFPKDLFSPKVSVGDRVKAGETILGHWSL